MNVKTTVAGYTRVSTQDQGMESLPDQERRIKEYAKSQVGIRGHGDSGSCNIAFWLFGFGFKGAWPAD